MRALRPFGAALVLLLATGSSADGASSAAHYIVFSLARDGTVEPVHAEEVTLNEVTMHSKPEAAVATRRDADAVGVSLRGANGGIVFSDVVDVPRILRGEFHDASGAGIDGHFHTAGDRAFVVRLPASHHATLEITAPGARRTSRFDVDTLLAAARARVAHSTTPVRASALAGWSNGDPGNRVDVLVLGDGYTEENAADFSADALTVIEGMFAVSPYRDYRNYVNATALFTPSLEAGADQPPYDPNCADYGFGQSCCGDASASGLESRFVSTAFDASYCTLDIQRLLTVNNSKIFTVAAAVPDWDQILVIVNAPVYGGSGGGLSVISMHQAAVDVAQHEYGHTFAALADEYSSPYPGYPPCSDVSEGAAVCERNVTDESRADFIKWAKWIDPSQSVPSSGPPPAPTDAGLWLGARYLAGGMYRQGYQCIMRSLGTPFCDVAAEAYVIRLYEGGWGEPLGGIDVIEPGSEVPPPGDVAVTDPGSAFAATLLGPVDGPDLDVAWLVDGIEVSTSSATNGATVTYVLETTTGQHTVQLRVTDVSPLLHPTTRPAFASTRTWNVAVGAEPTSTVPTTTLPATTTTSTTSEPTTSVTTTTSSTTSVTTPSTTTSTIPVVATTSTTVAVVPLCARPVSSGDAPLATDCLFLLNAAVGLTSCTPECVCAPKGVLPVTATDALVCLTAAVGGSVELRCPCGPFP